jgi:nucleotide-binding universal stress UspA family protein
MTFKHILIAVDDTPVSARAVELASELAKSLGAAVALLHVVDPALVVTPEAGLATAKLMADAEREGRRLLAGFRDRMALPVGTLEFLQTGEPAPMIVKTAKEWPADLVVIGTRARGGVRRALLGSVADGVMRHAPCPVLVIRAAD